ncbi:MAG: hypothetical protein P4L31_08780 [Candidatus Babeliales bacterium]|nr:hypothetical protein [Candidatus Babeliales bacterium]
MTTQEKNVITCLIQLHEQNKQEEIYNVVDEYLNKEQPSEELLVWLAIFFDQPPMVYYPKSIELVEQALKMNPNNPYAIIVLAYIYYYDLGEIPEEVFKRLESIHNENPEIQSMIEYVKSWYLKDKDHEKYVETLKVSISLCDKYVDNFIDLGRYYRENNKEEKGISLIKMGVANIQRVYPGSDETKDLFDNFFDQNIKGTYVTKWRYDDYAAIVKS